MLNLVVETTSLRRSAHGSVTAIIYFVGEGDGFPDVGWDDFVVIILVWWLEAVTRIARGFSRREALEFMDGPVSAQLEVGADGMIEVRGCRHGRVLQQLGRVSINTLIPPFLKAAAAILTACRAKGWASDDLDRLADRTEILRGVAI